MTSILARQSLLTQLSGELVRVPYPNTNFPAGKGFTWTYLRIIQKNLPKIEQIIDLTDIKGTEHRCNKTALSIFETEIKPNIEKQVKKEILDNTLGLITSIDGKIYSLNSSIELTDVINKKVIDISNKSLLTFSEHAFKRYIEVLNSQKRVILLERRDKNGKLQRMLVPLYTRYSKCYQDKVKKRMKWLIYHYGNRNAVTLCLTLDPKKFNNDIFLMWTTIKKEMNRFLTALKYYFRKRNVQFPKYIVSIEAQKNGNPHLHFVFLGCKRILDWRKIRDLWHLGGIRINRTYEGNKIRHPINYITKYITKTFTTTDNENVLTQSLTWLFNIRSFSTNRGLIIPLNPNKESDWRPVCLFICKKNIDMLSLQKFVDNLDNSPLNPVMKDHWIHKRIISEMERLHIEYRMKVLKCMWGNMI